MRLGSIPKFPVRRFHERCRPTLITSAARSGPCRPISHNALPRCHAAWLAMTNVVSEQSLPDLLEPGLPLIFCGINPGIRAASTGHHFAGRSNRFWRVMHLVGFTPEQILPKDEQTVLRFCYGLTTAGSRAKARARELWQSGLEQAGGGFARESDQRA